jgi:hypothetical protein
MLAAHSYPEAEQANPAQLTQFNAAHPVRTTSRALADTEIRHGVARQKWHRQ